MPSDWHGDEFFADVRTRVTGGVGQAAQDLKASLQVLIGIQGPPRSKPGEPPHRDTGALQASIEVNGPAEQGDAVFASVGTALEYGRYLEFGTSRMAARPWLSRGLYQNNDRIARTITGGGAGSTFADALMLYSEV